MYFVTPTKSNAWQRIIIRCNKMQAFMLDKLTVETTEEGLVAATREVFPEDSEETILQAITDIKDKVLALKLSEDILSVVDLC